MPRNQGRSGEERIIFKSSMEQDIIDSVKALPRNQASISHDTPVLILEDNQGVLSK